MKDNSETQDADELQLKLKEAFKFLKSCQKILRGDINTEQTINPVELLTLEDIRKMVTKDKKENKI